MTRGGSPPINAGSVVVISPTQITCIFDLFGVTADNNWAIRVTNPDQRYFWPAAIHRNKHGYSYINYTCFRAARHNRDNYKYCRNRFPAGVTEVRFSRDTGTLRQIRLTNINVVSSPQISGTLVIPAGQTVETLYVRVTNADLTTGISGSRIFSVLT